MGNLNSDKLGSLINQYIKGKDIIKSPLSRAKRRNLCVFSYLLIVSLVFLAPLKSPTADKPIARPLIAAWKYSVSP